MKGSPPVGKRVGVLFVVSMSLLLATGSSVLAANPAIAGLVPVSKKSSEPSTLDEDGLAAKGASVSSESGPDSAPEDGVPLSADSTRPQILSAPYRVERLGRVQNRRLREASGLALSTRAKNLAWAHNDSGYGPYVFAFDLQGEDRGRYLLEKSGSSDWEDMDAFRWKDESWLLVADTGDNKSKKPWYTLYLVAEPVVSSKRFSGLRPLSGVQSVRISYPTGPADTEAVAVDEVEGVIYLLTKRKRPIEVFTVPLEVFGDADAEHTARFETHMFSLPPPTLQDLIDYPRLGLALAQPNALDFSPDRTFAIVHTYGHSYRFDREPKQTWAEAFSRAPKQINVPRMKQGEAVAIGWDSESLYYTSEGVNPPIYRLTPETASDQ